MKLLDILAAIERGDSITAEEAKRVIKIAEAEARADERQTCWDEINRYVKTGDLEEPEHSQRNGLVLACNILRRKLEG